jgi:hypothetical protein
LTSLFLPENLNFVSYLKTNAMNNLPISISLLFGLTTVITVWLFYKAAGNSKITLLVITVWLGIQSAIGLSGFYTVTDKIPPRFLLTILPPVLFITGLFITSKGRKYTDSLNIKTLTILQIIRIPVEIVLFWLFIHKTVPGLMTFEGRNFDILSGLTAPVIYYFGFIKHRINKKIMLIWNFICLGLLINIIAIAILSAPFPFQRFAFDQPGIAVLYFPFNWLPACVVPLVLLSHLASIRQLISPVRQQSAIQLT